MQQKRGTFIVLEGPEGGGKTTQIQHIKTFLESQKIPVWTTVEPTNDSEFGRTIRYFYTHSKKESQFYLSRLLSHDDFSTLKQELNGKARKRLLEMEHIAGEILQNKWDRLPMFMQLGYMFDRYLHRKAEIERLKKGEWVVSDRDFLSTPAYGAGDGLKWQDVWGIHKEILGKHFLFPDIIMYVTVPLEVGLERTRKKQQRVHAAYEEMVKDREFMSASQIIRIDGSKTESVISNELELKTKAMIKSI